jgi:hypothetical protein
VKDEIEDLDEQLLRVNLKISQAQNEKSRMDEELRRYTKLGKQPKGNGTKSHGQKSNSMIEVQVTNGSTLDPSKGPSPHTSGGSGSTIIVGSV